MYKTLGIIALISLLISGCATPVVEQTKVITNPTIDGYPVDRCYVWGKNCDKPVADKICRDNGYQYSIKNSSSPKRPTKLLTGKICDASYCKAITYIECGRKL